MTPAIAAWGRLLLWAAVAVALVAVVPVRRPTPVPGLPLALTVGLVACVVLLFGLKPGLGVRRRSPVSVGVIVLLGVSALTEEAIWRRIVLGELLRLGWPTALVASTLGFSLVHPTRRWLHLGTGAAFGGLYLGTGAFAVCVAAHWGYNASVYLSRRPGGVS